MTERDSFAHDKDSFSEEDYDPKLSLILLEDYGKDLMEIAPAYGKRVIRETRKLMIYLGMEVDAKCRQ